MPVKTSGGMASSITPVSGNDDVDPTTVSEERPGDHRSGGSEGVDRAHAIAKAGEPPRYRCIITEQLRILASYWLSIHKTYQAGANRIKHIGYVELAEFMAARNEAMKIERDEIGKLLAKTLKKHPIYPWLKAHRGAPKGAHTARLIAIIGDPLRFPGRQCEGKGAHHMPEDYEGATCPELIYNDDGEAKVCGAVLGPVRRGSGRRSLRHYLGMHVVNGRFPRKKKGQQCDWNPEGRGAILQPQGIAEQIIMQRVEPWRTQYDELKERLRRERGVESEGESDFAFGLVSPADGNGGGVDVRVDVEGSNGPAAGDSGCADAERGNDVDGGAPGGGVDSETDSKTARGPVAEDSGRTDLPSVSEGCGGTSVNGQEGVERPCVGDDEAGLLRPFQIDSIARKRIGSRFVEDMMLEWKRIAREEVNG